MFTVKIRDHIMIAHSFDNPVFGPAQKLHGATYIVDACFKSETLDKNNIVIDIGLAHQVLKEVLAPLNYQNLDQLPTFKGKLTTTEYIAFFIHGQIAKKVKSNFKGILNVTLAESHIAWAGYEAPIS